MRYPDFLQKNGRVGFIAPSCGCFAEPYLTCFDQAKAHFESFGHTCIEGPNCRLGEGLGKSNTPEKCAAEINDFFINDKSDIIISCGGGETMCEDMPYVDFDGISKAKPKWYIGYSDNTQLVFTLPTICDTAAIYGPCVSGFGMTEWHQYVQDAYDILTGRKMSVSNYDKWVKDPITNTIDPLGPLKATEPFSMTFGGTASKSCKADFSGRLIGGCMDSFMGIRGSRLDNVKAFNKRYENDGIIWFMEACELSTIGVRRVLWGLDQAGWFENVKGFIFGRSMLYDNKSCGMTHDEAICSVVDKFNVPVIMNTDIGHLLPQMPIIAGAVAEVKAEPGIFNLNYKFI